MFSSRDGSNTISRKTAQMRDRAGTRLFKNPFLRALVVNGPQLAVFFKLTNPKAAVAALNDQDGSLSSIEDYSSDDPLEHSFEDDQNELNLAFQEKVDTLAFYKAT